MGHDLLGSQGDSGRVLDGKSEGFVVTVRVEALGSSQHSGQSLERYPGDVDFWLLGSKRNTGGLGVEAHFLRPFVYGSVPVTHPSGPNTSGSAKLTDFLEEIGMAIEEEGQVWSKGIHL